MATRKIEVRGFVTFDERDEAFGLPIEQIQKDLPEELGIGDLEDLEIRDVGGVAPR